MQKSASFQKAMLNKKPSEPPLEDGSVEDVGKEELQGYEEPLRTRLKVSAHHQDFHTVLQRLSLPHTQIPEIRLCL